MARQHGRPRRSHTHGCVPWRLAAGRLQLPYPVPFETPAQPSLFPLHLAYFTGSNGTLLAGNALFPLGAKGAYLLDRGVCSYDLDVQSAIFSQITSAVPNGIVDGIHSPCSGKGYSSLCDVLAGITISNVSAGVDLATFIDRNRIDSPYGGFVMLVNSTTDYRAFLNSASDSFNYTFTFDLSNPSSRGSGGILDVSYARNGEFDTGAFSQTIDGAEESNVPSSISDGVFSSALEKQAQPLPENITEFLNPKNKLPPECCGPSQPSYCYAPCANVPAAVPPPEGAYDDPSWYDVKYCGTSAPGAGGNDPADALLTIVSFEAGKQGMPTTAQNSLGATMTAKRADNPNEFQNVRCNFWPTYQTDHQCFPCISESGMCCPNGPPVPVCEVVARAKRVNVLPDKVELVWFDGPDLTKIGSAAFAPEYNNEALAIYLLLLAADANFSSSSCSTSFGPPVLPTQQLCQRQEEFNPFSRVFAHASGSASN